MSDRAPKRDYKAEFLFHLRAAKLPAPVTEFVFHPERKWRFDFCYVEQKIAIEYQGGIYFKGMGHQTTHGIERDCEKFTEASLMGYRLILITAKTVRDGTALQWIERALAL